MESSPTQQFSFSVCDQNVDFLKEPRFLQAYKFGIDSGHQYGVMPQEWQFYIACCLATHATNLDGDFVECGVNTGRISLAICKFIDFNSTGKRFYLFDTYRGMPEEQITEAERWYALEYNKKWYPDVYEIAKKNFTPFPNAQLVRGIVPDSLSQVRIDKVCYLHLDMNIVAPEIAAIEFFWERLVVGAVVLLDDYNFERHILQRTAMDEFAARAGTMVIPLPTGQGIIIKPYPGRRRQSTILRKCALIAASLLGAPKRMDAT